MMHAESVEREHRLAGCRAGRWLTHLVVLGDLFEEAAQFLSDLPPLLRGLPFRSIPPGPARTLTPRLLPPSLPTALLML